MVSRSAISVLVLLSACARPSAPPAPAYATGPTPDEFSEYELPESCAPLLGRVNAKGAQRLPAWIELSRCVAKAAIVQLELDDDEESVALLDEMSGPSMVLLDHVMDRGTVANRISALHAKAELFGRMGDLMLATADDRGERSRVEAWIEPWRQQARVAHRRIVALGDAHPELAANRQVQLAIRDSERKLATPIATRED